MIPITLQVCLLLGIGIYFLLILIFLKNKTLELRYTLLWILAGVFCGVLVICPGIITWLIRLVGIQDNMNGLFLILIAFLIIIVMSLTSIVSRQSNKIRTLIQELAILDKQVRDVQKEIEKE